MPQIVLKLRLRFDQGGNEASAHPDLPFYHFVYYEPFAYLDWQIRVVRKQFPGNIPILNKPEI